MIILQGKYNTAKVFTDNVDSVTIGQVIELLNQPFMAGAQVRIMPDCHAGAGCVIGTTFQIVDKVVPNLVGVDIGCGMYVVVMPKDIDMDKYKLDAIIHRDIPAGFEARNKPHLFSTLVNFDRLYCLDVLRNMSRLVCSVGTLGGGNHFIEIDEDEDNYYLVIHSGSRNLGTQVAKHYQDLAIEYWKGNGTDRKEQRQKIIDGLRAEKRGKDIPGALSAFDKHYETAKPNMPPQLCYLEGENLEHYLADVLICQSFAEYNRMAIAQDIMEAMGWTKRYSFTTVHNYIGQDKMLRKGAVSAQKDEMLIIPINMRDGSLICVGKGNSDWNYSAPHGAGRIMARGQAKRELKLADYEESMKGIYTTSVNQETLDESPMVYKPIAEIIENTQDTVQVLSVIKPVYNFKAGGE